MEWLSSKVNESVTDFNKSEVISDFSNLYLQRESQQFVNYKIVAYIFGTIIFLSNLTVVISSGLILKKGQQPKSTYLLLGNVSLADTIIGISIMLGASMEKPLSSSPLCVFQMGMLVCPAMVSIFSVGLIAIDRYIYILHGLYYQRWVNTTKVRIGILCIWFIGITLGFLPAVGWVNTELQNSRCFYVSLFPGYLILLNSFLSIVPIVVVAVLYSIILVKALRNVKEINAQTKTIHRNKSTVPEMRVYKGNGNLKATTQSVKFPPKNRINEITRSSSFNGNMFNNDNLSNKLNRISKSTDNINDDKETKNVTFSVDTNKQNSFDSNFSIYSINSSIVEQDPYRKPQKTPLPHLVSGQKKNKPRKEANKWRAIIIVMLTSGSFICTWMPFFITVIFFVLCQDKLTNPQCMHLRIMLLGPIATLAFLNSILNPLIYAWWHKGFQRSVRAYSRKCFNQYFRKDVLR